MQENPYHHGVLLLLADFVNDPPSDPAELRDRWNALGFGSPATAAEHDVRELRLFLDRWAEVVDAEGDAERADLVNALLAEAGAYPRITNHDGSGWHLHYRDDGDPLAAVIRALMMVAAARHLTEVGMHRIGRCALGECRRVFVDLTRGGRQRYCSKACANRDAVRRHRARRSAAPTGAD